MVKSQIEQSSIEDIHMAWNDSLNAYRNHSEYLLRLRELYDKRTDWHSDSENSLKQAVLEYLNHFNY